MLRATSQSLPSTTGNWSNRGSFNWQNGESMADARKGKLFVYLVLKSRTVIFFVLTAILKDCAVPNSSESSGTVSISKPVSPKRSATLFTALRTSSLSWMITKTSAILNNFFDQDISHCLMWKRGKVKGRWRMALLATWKGLEGLVSSELVLSKR